MKKLAHCAFAMLAAVAAVVTLCAFADGRKMIVHHKQGVSVYAAGNVGWVLFPNASLHVCGDTFLQADIDSVTIRDLPTDDTVRIVWNEAGAKYSNPHAESIHVTLQQGNVQITTDDEDALNIAVAGSCADGSLKISSQGPVNIVSKGLSLRSCDGAAINVQSKQPTQLECQGRTEVADADTRDEEAPDLCKACLYAQGKLIIKGGDSLIVTGNYKHAVQSGKAMEANAAIRVASAKGDGLKAKKELSVNGGGIIIGDTGNNAINVEKGNLVFNDGNIEITLETLDTKGIKTDSLYIQNGGQLSLALNADRCKGVKTKKGIHVLGGTICGEASGGVVVTEGDPSYCTFLKCDSDIVLANTNIELLHKGEGGKCISADGDVRITATAVKAKLTGNGGWYINEEGEDDYFTPRAIEAEGNLEILTGTIDIRCTGIGAKGMVCDRNLTIGKLHGDNDRLKIDITTEGASVVNNTDEDFRKGCPKAIKSVEQLDILSGSINIKTFGMGGEGLECRKTINIVGGDIRCETFDDGMNGGEAINVFGGNIYCRSQDNDGLDSNGCINIYDGAVYSISLHPRNESFDAEDDSFYIYGGTLLGLGGGTVRPGLSEIPYYCNADLEYGFSPMPTEAISLPKDKVLTIFKDGVSIMSGVVPADIDNVIITVASSAMVEGQSYCAIVVDGTTGGQELFDGLFRLGGEPFGATNILKFIFEPTIINKNK